MAGGKGVFRFGLGVVVRQRRCVKELGNWMTREQLLRGCPRRMVRVGQGTARVTASMKVDLETRQSRWGSSNYSPGSASDLILASIEDEKNLSRRFRYKAHPGKPNVGKQVFPDSHRGMSRFRVHACRPEQACFRMSVASPVCAVAQLETDIKPP